MKLRIKNPRDWTNRQKRAYNLSMSCFWCVTMLANGAKIVFTDQDSFQTGLDWVGLIFSAVLFANFTWDYLTAPKLPPVEYL